MVEMSQKGRMPLSSKDLDRREFMKSMAASAAITPGLSTKRSIASKSLGKTYDVAVVGAGVFGAWTAYYLQRAGTKTMLLDAYGPSNARASSGGESRIIRAGYGPDEVYTNMSVRALKLWHEFFDRTQNQALFQPTGVLWLARGDDAYQQACLKTLARTGVPVERFSHDDLNKRYPQINSADIAWAFLEPAGGVLLARRCVQAIVQEGVREGVEYRLARIRPLAAVSRSTTRLDSVINKEGEAITAGAFVFACGPWLPQVFPDLLGRRIFPTRQEVYFVGVPEEDNRFRPPAMPAWIFEADQVYGIPDIENRGFKLALDSHGLPFNPDNEERMVTSEGIRTTHAYLARRFPALEHAPIVETRVCQYENTSNGDFLIDRHPQLMNVWLVGGGSGHGFKHGPAVGEHVAVLLNGTGTPERRFSLATKSKVQQRTVF
jgi:sarcosine oxidase